MKFIKQAIFIILIMIMQFSIFPRFSLGYYEPDLLLALTILFGLMRSAESGCIIGLSLGMLTDVNSSVILGSSAFSWIQVGFASALVSDRVLVDNPLVQVAAVGSGCLLAGFFQILFYRFTTVEEPLWVMMLMNISQAGMSCLFAYPLAKILIYLKMIPEHHHE